MRKNVTIVVCLIGAVVLLLFEPSAVSEELASKMETPRVTVEVDSSVTAGTEFTASILLPDTTDSLGGFSLLLEYDFDAVVVDSAVRGSLLAGEWEYFIYRTDLLPEEDPDVRKAYLRLVAIADQDDNRERTPSPRSRIGAGELVKIYFYATENDEYLNKRTQLRFRWNDCRSNSFSDPTGNQTYLSDRVFAHDGSPYWRGGDLYSGADSSCFRSSKNQPLRYFNFYSTSFTISPPRSPLSGSDE